ncbi:hypothetical protein M9H77_10421 [Catharanthus roseus]|uniref:Uncharacterized protein n=1 Tax=Catharanthus roseus TaxID=4058 RepID=A0ACC0C3F2_CATRO|nr:hypothetical protein M9H77_10421 [Catharanthus roseus]
MPGDKKIFLDLDTSITSTVRLGNGAIVAAKGKALLLFFVKGGEDKVYKLKKALKKAKRAWYGEIDIAATPLAVNEKLKKNYGSKKVDAPFYRSLIASLMYLTGTRLNIIFAVGLLSR